MFPYDRQLGLLLSKSGHGSLNVRNEVNALREQEAWCCAHETETDCCSGLLTFRDLLIQYLRVGGCVCVCVSFGVVLGLFRWFCFLLLFWEGIFFSSFLKTDWNSTKIKGISQTIFTSFSSTNGLLWTLCTLYLLACQVRARPGDSGLGCWFIRLCFLFLSYSLRPHPLATQRSTR